LAGSTGFSAYLIFVVFFARTATWVVKRVRRRNFFGRAAVFRNQVAGVCALMSRRFRPPSDQFLLAMLLIVLSIIVVRAVLRWWWR
jgi:hypothetical protein